MSDYRGNKGLEYYRAYPRDFFEGVVGMPGQLRGFYRLILDLIYMHDGFLIDDWNHISGHTGYSPTLCKRMIQKLIETEKIGQEKGDNCTLYTNNRAKTELKHARKFQEKQKKNIAARWKNNDLAEEVVIPPQDHKTTRQKEAIASQKNGADLFDEPPPKPKPKRATSIPENWVPNDANVDHALSKNLTHGEIANEADKFRDHHLAKGTTFKDWNAGWRTWVANSIKFNRTGNGRGMARGATPEKIADFAARYVAGKQAGG